MVRSLAAFLLVGLTFYSGVAAALGLGELELRSRLNEPLEARIPLRGIGGLSENQIRVKLGSRDDFERLGMERVYFLTTIEFGVTLESDSRGYVTLRSEEPVLEPYLDFVVEVRWPTGRLLREYTALMDLPAFAEEPAVSASARTAPEKTPADAPEAQVAEPRRTQPPPRRNSPAYGAEATEAPQPGDQYLVKRDETLWGIASRARPQGASVQQTMLDIQRLNPDAFIDGNINRIKAGYLIYLPGSSDISTESQSDALAAVQRQNRAWREKTAALPALDETGTEPRLRVVAESDGRDPSQQQVDNGTAGTGSASGGEERLAALEQAERQVTELQNEVDVMSRQIETLERLVELKDNQISALQSALEESQQQVAVAPVPGEQPEPGPPAAAEQEGDDSRPDEDVATPEQAAPSPAPAAAKPPVVESDQGGGSWIYYILGILLLGLLGGMFYLQRRRRGREEEDELYHAAPVEEDNAFDAVELQDTDVEIDTTEEEHEEAGEPVQEQSAAVPVAGASAGLRQNDRGYGENKHDEYAADVDSGDTLAEADIYIAYGRFPQAIKLLQTAIESDNSVVEYHLKLMEIYAETGELEKAREEYARIEATGEPEAVARADEILRDVHPSATPPAATSRPVVAQDTTDWQEEPEESGQSQEPPRGSELALEDDQDVETSVTGEDEEAEHRPLGMQQQAAEESRAPADAGAQASNPLLDDDYDATLWAGDSGADESEMRLGAAGGDDDEFSGLTIEDEGLGEIEGEEQEELDLSADIDEAIPERDGEDKEEDFVYASDSDAVTTQLDLARAYIEMGDDQGAREILEEILTSGAEDQQQEARELLQRLV